MINNTDKTPLTINGKAITVKPMTAQDYGNYGLGMYPFLDELDAVLAKSNGQLSAKDLFRLVGKHNDQFMIYASNATGLNYDDIKALPYQDYLALCKTIVSEHKDFFLTSLDSLVEIQNALTSRITNQALQQATTILSALSDSLSQQDIAAPTL